MGIELIALLQEIEQPLEPVLAQMEATGIRIDIPYLSFPITDKVINDVKQKEDIAISQIKDALNANPNKIAGLIIEPIQGEGGDNHFRSEFFMK